jgi:hypothetical protein
MLEYFLLPNLTIDKQFFTNKVIKQSESWGHFGTDALSFTLECLMMKR